MLSQGLFGFSCCPASRLGVHRNLEGDIDRTTDPKWLKGYSLFLTIRCHAEQLNWGELAAGFQPTAWALLGQWSAEEEQLHCSSLVLCNFYHYFPFLFCPVKLSLSKSISFTIYSNSLPTPLGRK